MRINRVYVNRPLAAQQPLLLDERTSHYLGHVLRLRPGATIHAFNGEGGCYVARIDRLGRDGVTVVPVEFLDEERESGLAVTLAHGIARGQRMDYTIQKAVELGARRIVPLLTERGQVRLRGERADRRLEHWRGVITSACEQCGRNRIPAIDPPVALGEWVQADANGLKLVLWPGADQALGEVAERPAALTLLSGPEGGLGEQDLEAAVRCGYRPVRLGPRILRTETAAVAGLAVCQALWGDLR